MIIQKNRNKKSSVYNRSSSDPCRTGRFTSSGGAPLDPIFENDQPKTNNDIDDSDDMCRDGIIYNPMRDYMSRTILKHFPSQHNDEGTDSSSPGEPQLEPESRFQIVADNAPTHPEFIVTKRRPSKPQNSKGAHVVMMMDNRWEDSNCNKLTQSQMQQLKTQAKISTSCSCSAKGRWGSGGSPSSTQKRVNFSNVSNSSIDTSSTSSLSSHICDEDDPSVEFFDETKDMTSREIIESATDVIAGNFDYNNGTLHSNSSNNNTKGRRQARRSSMPTMQTMPATSTTPISFVLPSRPPKSSLSRSSTIPRSFTYSYPLKSSSVVLDKFGIPIRPTSSIIINNNNNNNTERRRRERRSSNPTRPDSEPVDAPPISKSTSSTHDSLPTESSSVVLDKFGIPIRPTPPTESSSNNTGRRRRRKERRSSMPTKFGFLVDSTPSRPKRRGRRPSMPMVSTDTSPPTSSNTGTASAMRFFPEELQIPVRTPNDTIVPKQESAPSNGAPIRPVRVPSVDSLGKHGGSNVKKVLGRPNSQWGDADANTTIRPTDSKSTTHNDDTTTPTKHSAVDSDTAVTAHSAPIRPERVPSVDSFGSHTGGSNLKKVLGRPNSQWGDADANQAAADSNISSDVSVNSLQQQDGEWWW